MYAQPSMAPSYQHTLVLDDTMQLLLSFGTDADVLTLSTSNNKLYQAIEALCGREPLVGPAHVCPNQWGLNSLNCYGLWRGVRLGHLFQLDRVLRQVCIGTNVWLATPHDTRAFLKTAVDMRRVMKELYSGDSCIGLVGCMFLA